MQQGITLVEDRAEGWFGCVEFATHVDILRALASEEKGDSASGYVGSRGALQQAGGLFAVEISCQLLAQLIDRAGGQGQAVGKMAAGNLGGITEIDEGQIRRFGQKVVVLLRLGQ